jgi:group I intron endonuclease
MSSYAIYKCTNKINNKSYIGFDSNWPSRKRKHLYDAFNINAKNYNCHFYRALRKYDVKHFQWEIIYESDDKNHCLNIMEPHFIKEHNTFNDGYNMTQGGEGTFGKKSFSGRKHTEETKKKISDSNKGRIFTDEHCINISKAKKGSKRVPHSEEHKNKISKSLTGIKKGPITEEHKQKISKASSGGNHYNAIPVTINDITYSCKKEASEKLNLSKHYLNKLLTTDFS